MPSPRRRPRHSPMAGIPYFNPKNAFDEFQTAQTHIGEASRLASAVLKSAGRDAPPILMITAFSLLSGFQMQNLGLCLRFLQFYLLKDAHPTIVYNFFCTRR